MQNGGLRNSGGPAQKKSPDVSSNANRSARPRDGGNGNVSGPPSNPKKTSGGAFLTCRRMLALMKFVAATSVGLSNPIPIGWYGLRQSSFRCRETRQDAE